MTTRFSARVLMIAAVFIVAGSPLASGPGSLTFITEDYPPYNYQRDGELKGLSVRVLEAMLEAMGSEQTLDDVRVLPWARGYETTLSQPNTVLFSTTRTAAREDLFEWVGPLAVNRVVLMARRDAGIQIPDARTLRKSGHQIAVIHEDVGAQRLEEEGVDEQRIVTAIDNVSALHMLQAGRVDLWAYGEDVAYWLMEEKGIDPGSYQPVYTLSAAPLYFAVSQGTDRRLVTRLQSVLDRIRKQDALSQAERLMN